MSTSTRFLCYDLKGIQSFIFAVPRLRYICGGSAIIDRFDREFVKGPTLSGLSGVRRLFSGGGKGAFVYESEQAANTLQNALVAEAHQNGLGISIGRHEKFSEAAQKADRFFPYLPSADELDGHPCAESGLYPVPDGQTIHPMIARRDWDAGEHMARWFEEELLTGITLPQGVAAENVAFVHDVDAESKNPEGLKGAEALGNRNRWAIIAMDGNDMGNQHRAACERFKNEPETLTNWIEAMSEALDECSRGACCAALEHVIEQWSDSMVGGRSVLEADRSSGKILLPFRPLVVGGDDIVVICHVEHAMDFVKRVCERFTQISREKAAEHRDRFELWPATGGQLTISAGVLFAPVSLPLAAAIPYAESLLASAKGKGRKLAKDGKGEPTPACVDWESVTEGVIDTPSARRQREMRFYDPDINEVVSLTQRPYTIEELAGLEALARKYDQDVPATIRHQVLPGLRTGYWNRQVFAARLGKRDNSLVLDLQEPKKSEDLNRKGRWKPRGEAKRPDGTKAPERATDVADALLLLEEQTRMTRETV